MRHITKDAWLGFLFLAIGLLILFVWIPLDTDTGFIEKVRRSWVIGDSLAPSISAVIISLSALWLIFSAQLGNATKPPDAIDIYFVLKFFLLLVAALLIMRWAGPLLIEDYRPLRDTMPWKLIGYMAGGTVMVSGLICFVERKVTLKRVALGFLITLAVALIYDLPFEDLLLPPNGDV